MFGPSVRRRAVSSLLCGGALAAFVAAFSSAACTSATPSDAVACAIRPATYPPSTELPYVAAQDSTKEPNCEPTCGVDRQDSYFPVAAVPMGACDFVDGYRCDMPARGPCPSASQTSAQIDDVRCTCASGEWSCVVIRQGAGSGCSPSAVDASNEIDALVPDAAPDAL